MPETNRGWLYLLMQELEEDEKLWSEALKYQLNMWDSIQDSE